MPYRSVSDLPESVRSNLPRRAQEIYLAAFNSAWESYEHEEARAHRVAWAAVKHQFEKDAQGHWVPKAQGEAPPARR